MASGTFVKFHASRQAVVNLLVLGATLVLPMARVRLLKLQKQSATIVLPSYACHLAHLRPNLYSQGGCARITVYMSGKASFQLPL